MGVANFRILGVVCVVGALISGRAAYGAPVMDCKDRCALKFVLDSAQCLLESALCGPLAEICFGVCGIGASREWGSCNDDCNRGGGKRANIGVRGYIDANGSVSIYAGVFSDTGPFVDATVETTFYALPVDMVTAALLTSATTVDALPWIPLGRGTVDERTRLWTVKAVLSPRDSRHHWIVRADFDDGQSRELTFAIAEPQVALTASHEDRNRVEVTVGRYYPGDVITTTPTALDREDTLRGVSYGRRLSPSRFVGLAWTEIPLRSASGTCSECKSRLTFLEMALEWYPVGVGREQFSLHGEIGMARGSFSFVNAEHRQIRRTADGITVAVGASWTYRVGSRFYVKPSGRSRFTHVSSYPEFEYESVDSELRIGVGMRF
jgi:hypothetical protein